jgi:nucleotide-binding universal stress UspA family protein
MKTIIAATDFSDASGAAFKEAAKLAKTLNARLLLVFVQYATDMRFALKQGIPLDFQNSAELRKELAKFIDKKFDSIIRKYGGNNSKFKTIVLRGIPWQEINKLTCKRKADLVFVGSRGLSPLKAIFRGSTTQNLILTCPCPVVMIHKPNRVNRKKAAA